MGYPTWPVRGRTNPKISTWEAANISFHAVPVLPSECFWVTGAFMAGVACIIQGPASPCLESLRAFTAGPFMSGTSVSPCTGASILAFAWACTCLGVISPAALPAPQIFAAVPRAGPAWWA